MITLFVRNKMLRWTQSSRNEHVRYLKDQSILRKRVRIEFYVREYVSFFVPMREITKVTKTSE